MVVQFGQATMPWWLRAAMSGGLSAIGQQRTAQLLASLGKRSADEYGDRQAAGDMSSLRSSVDPSCVGHPGNRVAFYFASVAGGVPSFSVSR